MLTNSVFQQREKRRLRLVNLGTLGLNLTVETILILNQ